MPKTIDPPGEFDYHVEKIEVTTAADSRVVFVDGRLVITGSFISPPGNSGRDMVPVVLPGGIRVPVFATKWSPMLKTDWVADGPPRTRLGEPLELVDFKWLLKRARIDELENTIRLAQEELKALEAQES